MTMNSKENIRPYRTVLVRSAKPPIGVVGSDWHQYVIAYRGRETIQGRRCGSFSCVSKDVKAIVAKLNDRHYRHLGEKSRARLGIASLKQAGKPSVGFWHA